MTRRFAAAIRICVFLLAVAALASSLTLNALPFPNAAATNAKQGATVGNSPVFLVAPSISVAGKPSAIAAGDLNRDGVPDLVVTNAQTGNVDVLLGNGKGGFQAPVPYKIGGSPVALVLGDLAGHGKIDIAVANQSGNSVSILLGKGDGTFQAAGAYSVGSGPVSLAIGDFNGDGHADLLVANAGSNTLAVLTNNGDGTFQNAKSYGVTASPRALAVADFNGDGKLDVASGNADGTVNILLGDGTGRLNVAATMSAATKVSALVVGDFNGDGRSDLAVADPVAGTVGIFLGRGDGSFQSASVLSVGSEPVSLAVEDVNADGMLDLLAVNRSGNTVSVMLGAGDGTFQSSSDYVVGNSPVAVAIADFKGNGHLDLATANSADGSVTVPLGNGDGTFQAAQDYRTHLERKTVAVGDLDGDGHPDVVVASFCGSDLKCDGYGTASVFLSNGKGALKPASIYPLGKGPVSIALADVNGDKKLDLIAVNRDDGTLIVLLGNGDGTFQEGLTYPAGVRPVSVSVGDFNKDGKPDLAIATLCGSGGCHEQGSLNVLLGNGDGSFRSGASYDVGFSPAAVAVGDVDGDGKLDLVVANSCGKSVACSKGTASVLIGDGKGSFALKGELDLGKRVSSVALADLNKDGKLDLVAANSADNQVGVLLGNGDGTFSSQIAYSVGGAPSAVVVAEFKSDGSPDVAVANLKDSTVSLLSGNGDGTLRNAVAYPVGFGPDALVALDLDSSGRLALVTANGNSGGSPVGNDITVLANAGAGPLATSSTTTTVASSPNPSEFGQSVTFTATVTPSPDGGTVDFTFGSTALCSGVNLTAGVATCAYATLPVGSDPITAVYSGDASFGGSTGTLSPNQTVNKTATTTTVTALPPSPSVFNQTVTFTATVAAVPPGGGTPTGTVDFTADGNPISPACTGVTLNGSAQATCATATLSVGAHSIVATYTPTGGNFTGSSGTLPYTVGKGGTTTTVAAVPPSPSTFGQSVTFTATVSVVAPGVGTPTGTVDFTADGNPISPACTGVTLNGSAQATCATATLSVGAHSIVATYTPTGGNFTGSSGTLPYTVGKGGTTTTVAAVPPSSSTFGQSVTFTATVSVVAPGVGTPTGTVDFTADGNPISPACTGVTLNGSAQATCATAKLTVGTHSIVATYTPTGGNFTGSSGTLSYAVGKAATTITVAAVPPSPSTFGQAVTFTATVSVVAPGVGTPTGTVDFKADGNDISGCGAMPLNGSLQASCTTATLSGGGNYQHAITVFYSGDASFQQSDNTTSPLPYIVEDFTLALNQNTVTIIQAFSDSTTLLTVQSYGGLNGASGNVTGTCSFPANNNATCAVSGTINFAPNGSVQVPIQVSLGNLSTGALTGVGSYTLTLTVTDSTTNPIIVHSVQFTVVVTRNQPPSCTVPTLQLATDQSNGDANVVISFTCTDAESTLNQPEAQVTLNWGSTIASPSPQIGVPYSGGNSYPPAANPPSQNLYTVTVTAIDNALQTFSFSQPITVAPVFGLIPNSGSSSQSFSVNVESASTSTVNFSCQAIAGGNLVNPADPTSVGLNCVVGPSSATLSGTPTPVTVTLGLQSATASSTINFPTNIMVRAYSIVLILPAMVFCGGSILRRHASRKVVRATGAQLLGLLLILMAVAGIISCGGGFTPPPQAKIGAGNYTVLVIGTDTTTGSVTAYVVAPVQVGQ